MKRISQFLGAQFLTVAGVAIIALTMTSRSHAAVAYGIDGNGNLRLITSLATMSSVVLGSTPFISGGINVGLAIDSAGQLFAGDAGGNIYSLTPNGIPTLIGNPGQGPISGLDWDPATGQLLAISGGGSPNIFRVSPITGAVVGPTVPASLLGNTPEGIAYYGGGLGLVTYRNGGITAVQLINLATGGLFGTPAVSGVVDNWTGVDVDDSTGNIYMLGWFDDSWQVTNSAGNLTAAHLATGNHLDWTAFTISLEVPEPASGWLFALGCGTALLRRRRRRIPI